MDIRILCLRLLFISNDGHIQLEINLSNETIWLTQQQIAYLFGTKHQAISKHLKNIFISGELKEDSVCSILEHTAQDRKTYKTKFYSLDAVLSVVIALIRIRPPNSEFG